MKALLREWVRGTKNLPAWFKHNEEIEITWQQIEELFATGNNVMVVHLLEPTSNDSSVVMITVDEKRFQR